MGNPLSSILSPLVRLSRAPRSGSRGEEEELRLNSMAVAGTPATVSHAAAARWDNGNPPRH